jgi:hypothetical protein
LDTQQFFTTSILELVDTGHQRLCRRFLFVGGLGVPGSAAKNFGTTVKGGDVIFQRVGTLLADVQTFFSPPLDGVGKFDVEIFDIRTSANNNTAYVIGDVVRAITAKAEDALPQSPIGLDSKEALAKCDKNRNVEDGVGSQLMKLQPVNKKQTTEKIVDGSRKAANKMVDKANPIFHRGIG